jgi:Protein of unknown function (DUF2950)
MKISHSFIFGLVFSSLALSWPIHVFGFDGDAQAPGVQRVFSEPGEAIDALVIAAEHNDTNAMQALFGPDGKKLVSPDAVQAASDYQMFVNRLKERVTLATNTDGSVSLQIGNDAWPFPIPLVNWNGKWCFDTIAGKQEILNRRIGMNELGAIDVCRAYVEAQREYASQDHMDDSVLAYAQNLHSSPGKQDGLYWSAVPGEPLSPFGPLVAAARMAGYHHARQMLNEQTEPYHGYYFKILTRQGKHAPGGKYDYIINGHMIAGFALVAWPAEWGNTGIMTFIVNQQGRVYQQNLGKNTAKISSRMSVFDPDDKWTIVQ